MKVSLKGEYLKYLLQQNHNQGLTWIESLGVIFVIGVLAAIVPTTLNRLDTNSHSEAEQYIRSMNRAQQAYHAEMGYYTFADSIDKLGLGIKPDTENYHYRIHVGMKTGRNRYQFVFPDQNTSGPFQSQNGKVFPAPGIAPNSSDVVMMTALPKKRGLKSYVELVFTCQDYSTGGTDCSHESLTFASLYESEQPSVPHPHTLIVSFP